MSNLPKTSQPATQALEVVGVTQLEQLTEWRESDLIKLHGMGPKAVRIFKETLAEKGLSFKAESAFPNIGQAASRALALVGLSELEQLSNWSESELLKIHGVGPKAIRILREALDAKGLSFKA